MAQDKQPVIHRPLKGSEGEDYHGICGVKRAPDHGAGNRGVPCYRATTLPDSRQYAVHRIFAVLVKYTLLPLMAGNARTVMFGANAPEIGEVTGGHPKNL